MTSETDMVEKAARALAEEIERQAEAAGGVAYALGAEYVIDARNFDLAKIARTTIAAMREPLKALSNVGYDAAKKLNEHGLLFIQLEAAVDAMIDAALSKDPR